MFNPTPVNQSTISVCVRLGGLAAIGGLETWFWALQEYVLSSNDFRLHAVNLESLHDFEPSSDRFYYARYAVARIVESGARFNIGPDEIIDECDVVLSSWVDPPIRPPSGRPSFKSIIVIHGSDAIEEQGTWFYAHNLNAYDAAVCVSAGCMDAYGTQFQKENNLKKKNKFSENVPLVDLQYIPSSIDLAKYDSTTDMTYARDVFGLPTGKNQKILGFLGRIAEDKNPQLFVDVVSNLPKKWIGAMAGPLYLPDQMVSNVSSHIHLVGDVQEPWTFLAAVDALYVPSKEEGGPIVLLEAWAMVKPFFMRRTGLAVDHEDGVFIVPDNASPQDIATFIDGKINTSSGGDGDGFTEEVQKKVEYGLKTVKEQFSSEVLKQKYHTLMTDLLENAENEGQKAPKRLSFQVHYPKGVPPAMEVVQLTRRGRTIWARCFNKNCIFYIKFGDLDTKASSRKVNLVARTFSGSSKHGASATDDDDGVAIAVRGEKGTERLASIDANTARQSVSLSLPTNVFAIQMVDGQSIQILDVLSG